METVTKRELNQHTAAVLARADDGVEIVVTERGRPRWRVSGYSAPSGGLDRLQREGRYTPPSTDAPPWPADGAGAPLTSSRLDDLLDESRGDH
ncbi:type II toxin-antitoxin system Phd/YefM family antitoxin [Cellulomonas sp. Y8]|uniref:type II toxin-antitoxin system Phd/YefM family antitoxin n=1 Tax=Cellulomonas sp. Y8 TaxID=2591145 RepID=UPI003D75CE96